jgi:anti-sigma factor RsiW
MRGNLTDQDFTDYALNELDSGQRLYVESMLAVSVECRNDVYEMLDLAQMLEEGFENDANRTVVATLTPEQRARLTAPRRRRAALAFVNKTAATIAVAACVAFALTNPHLWRDNDRARKVASVGSHMTQIVSQAVVPASEEVDISPFVNLETLADDSSNWLQAASDALPQPTEICTPPSWLENSGFSDLH